VPLLDGEGVSRLGGRAEPVCVDMLAEHGEGVSGPKVIGGPPAPARDLRVPCSALGS
jgi:hypothetical protein